MAKIYGPPEEIGDAPQFNYRNMAASRAAEGEYLAKIVAYAKANGEGECAGEEIRFGVADGYARYIVLSSKPVKLIHLPFGDAYQFQYAHRLTAKDVKHEVERGRAMSRLFASKPA